MREAVFDPLRTYRYALAVSWAPALPRACWVMLNPSTADEHHDDPTLRRCQAFSRAWGCGSLVVVNLFAYRATKPSRLRHADNPVGPENDLYIDHAAAASHIVLCGWGIHGTLLRRNEEVMALLHGHEPLCLGTTREGHPRHPLYVRGDVRPIPYDLP